MFDVNIQNTYIKDVYKIVNSSFNDERGSLWTFVDNQAIKTLVPYEQETDYNAFLKSPAGITSVKSETEGALGAVRSTTVSFQVHNFEEYYLFRIG